jgi:hypothetical protein
MTLKRRLRVMRHRAARATRVLRPRQLLMTLTLVVAMGVAVALLVLVVSENAVSTSANSSTPPSPSSAPTTVPKTAPKTAPKTTTPTTQPVAPTVPLGVYAGPGAPVAAAAFSADVGAPVPYAFDYIDGTTWQSIASPQWFLERWDGSGFRMIWGVPMLPASGATLAAGAAGQYDAYFSQLAYTLISNGQGSSVIMLGWDPEDAELPWVASSTTAAAQYVAYWHQIVTTMRSVAGAQFQFAWDASAGPDPQLLPSLYPGNSYVNIIATDAFDQGSSAAGEGWNEFAEGPYGPDWFSTFADHHDKPLMIAKWGLVPTAQSGGGDNVAFVSQFLRWADARHLFAAVTWDYGTWALTGGAYPKAAAALRTVAEAGADTPIAKVVES